MPAILSRVNCRGNSGSCPVSRSPGITASSEILLQRQDGSAEFQNLGRAPLIGVATRRLFGGGGRSSSVPCGRREWGASPITMRLGWLARAAFVLCRYFPITEEA